jgi:hypothetical protein
MERSLLMATRQRLCKYTDGMIEGKDFEIVFDYEQSRDHVKITLLTGRAKSIHPGVWCSKFHDYPYGGTYMILRSRNGDIVIYVTSLETTMTDGM